MLSASTLSGLYRDAASVQSTNPATKTASQLSDLFRSLLSSETRSASSSSSSPSFRAVVQESVFGPTLSCLSSVSSPPSSSSAPLKNASSRSLSRAYDDSADGPCVPFSSSSSSSAPSSVSLSAAVAALCGALVLSSSSPELFFPLFSSSPLEESCELLAELHRHLKSFSDEYVVASFVSNLLVYSSASSPPDAQVEVLLPCLK
jgi:hypothetical protein